MIRGVAPIIAALMLALLATPVSAQIARVAGQIRDVSGKAIKGATVRAANREATPSEFTATSDDKGRWAMIGLRSGNWTFTIHASGFAGFEGTAGIRAGMLAPINITLVKDLGPLPGALDSNIQKQLASAHTLRNEGRFEQAIAAYLEIQEKNPKLTAMHLVIGNAYRTRASKETDTVARRVWLDRAVESLSKAVKADASSDHARLELASAEAAVSASVPR